MARPSPITNSILARRNSHRGFTLAECLIASVVLSVTVLGVCGALASASAQIDALEVETHCMSMARQLMEEVAARSFDPPASNDNAGWSSGNQQRGQYDNIADFDGVVEYIDPMSTATTLADTLEIMRTVSVEFRSTPSGGTLGTDNFALITVTVTPSSHAGPFTLRRVVARSTIMR